MKDIQGIQFINDDLECIKILMDEGMLHLLKPRNGFNQVSATFKRGDAMCLAIYDGTPGDSGYMVMMIPAKVMTQDQAVFFFARFIAEVSEGELEATWEEKANIQHN